MVKQIITQAIGIVAMIFNILSYQGKNSKQILSMQFIGTSLFAVNYFMLGAYTGALLNLFSVVRALYLFKFKKPKKFMIAVFSLIIVGLYVLSFTVFKTEPTLKNFLVELLPVVAQIIATVAFFTGDAKKVRYLGYISCPCWLAYNIICFTIGGILCECFSIISITVGIIRYHKKPKTKDGNASDEVSSSSGEVKH